MSQRQVPRDTAQRSTTMGRRVRLGAGLLLAAGFLGSRAERVAIATEPRPAGRPNVDIPFEKSKLPNGMTVIFHVDRTSPLAVVNLMVDVGSRMEEPGRTGFAHLFEHLMFMGTERAPTGAFDSWLEGAGAWNNAWTSQDRTDYFEVGPPTALGLFLWLDADRLRDLGPSITRAKLDAQREVVRNERRQTSENRPYGIVELRLPELVWPEGHPYHHPVIGSHEDLEAATVSDVRAFFSKWYDPANTSLVVAGPVAVADWKPKIERWFGTIPSRAEPRAETPAPPAPLQTIVRETVQDDVELAKVVMVWRSPKQFSEGDAELDLLSAVLASGKGSRLIRALVFEGKLAQEVEVTQRSGALASEFVLEVLARPGVSLDAIEAAVWRELAKVRTTPVKPDELTRAKNGYESAFVRRLEGPRDRASLLNLYETALGDPGFASKDLERYRNATPEAVRDVAARVLDPKAHVVLRVVPRTGATTEKKGAAR